MAVEEKSARTRVPTILLVEDNDAQRFTLARILEGEGFTIECCSSGREALALLESRQYGAAVVDLRLPDVSGLRVVEMSQQLTPRVRCIIHTGYGSFGSAKEALNLGAFAYVEKLRDPEELVRHVRRAIQEYLDDALQASEHQYQTLIEQASDGVFISHSDGRYIDVNTRASQMLGYSREELLSLNIRDLVVLRAGDPPLRFPTLKPGESFLHERNLRRKDGSTLTVEISGKMLSDGRLQAFVRDISERLRHEEQRRRLAEQLRQSQKMEAIGRLAGGIAHDFNNILTAILGSAEFAATIVRQEAIDSPDLLDALDQIEKAGERAAALTRQLLQFSRREDAPVSTIDPARVLHEVYRMLRRLVRANLTLELDAPAESAPVRLSSGQFEQIVMNLVLNARDAIAGEGRISLRLEILPDHDDPPGRCVLLRVKDTGAGMTPDVVQRLFEPFFTTKSVARGTGLGLSIVYGIVKGAGGRVVPHSEPGQGSTFDVLLPVAARTTPSIDVDLDRPSGGGEDVLVCDDELPVRNLVCTALEQNGYKVFAASSGVEALELAERRDEPFDLLITDVVMDKMSGPDLASLLRERGLARRTLFISGYTADLIGEDELQSSRGVLLLKPFTPSELLRRVRGLLDEAEPQPSV